MTTWPEVPIRALVDDSRHLAASESSTHWLLNLDQVESGTGRVLHKVRVAESDLGTSTHAFDQGTVLYSKLRPYLNKVIVADEAGYATTELIPIRCRPDRADAQYVAHYLRSPRFLAFASATVSGAKMPRMVMSEFWSAEVPLPPLPEQRRIAAILDQADALRAKRREALAQLDSLTQSIFIEMFGDPATNSLGLPLASLSDLGIWHSGGTPPRETSCYFEGNIPWFSSGELEGMYVDRSAEHISEEAVRRTSAKLVRSGSLMLGMYDTAALKASIAAVDCACNQAIAFSQIDANRAEVVYVYYAIVVGREHFRRLQRGVRQKNLNLSMIRQIQIPNPSLVRQRLFATRIQSIESLKATHRAALAESDALFASLQHRAFAGQLS